MAYKEPDVDGQESEWNEALFKMKRLHELQTEIIKCNMMPLSKHFMTGEWNYIILFRSICALYAEGNAKYKQTELDEINKLKDLIDKHLKFCPPFVTKNKVGYGNTQKHSLLNVDNWELLKCLLSEFEFKVRKFNDVHGLSTKNKENMDGRSILR